MPNVLGAHLRFYNLVVTINLIKKKFSNIKFPPHNTLMRILKPEMNFEGTATWKGATECELSIKGNKLVTVSPPPSFGGKEGYCVPEDIFAAALASCINTLFLLIAKNSQLRLLSASFV